MSLMEVMDRTGHREVRWNPANAEEVEFAREQFDSLTDDGYQAFRVERGKPGVRMATFDPAAESMILVPQRQGG